MSQTRSLHQVKISVLNGVGPRLESVLANLHIRTVQDLLFHLPVRYLDRTRITAIRELRNNTSVVIQGTILSAQVLFGRRRSLAVTIEDSSGKTVLRFYHFTAQQKNNFEAGRLIRCYGDPRLGAKGIEFYHPEYEFLDAAAPTPVDSSLTPVYGLTEGLSQQRIRKLVEQAIRYLNEYTPDELLPAELNKYFDVSSLSNALEFLHFPPPNADVLAIMERQHPYQKRLALEELVAHYLARLQLRLQVTQHAAPTVRHQYSLATQLIAALPFEPTGAQLRVLREVRQDFKNGTPMLRMLQGDVGSGKTLVAALTSLDVVEAGYQVAVVAPTEILAEQHLINFSQWCSPLGLHVTWLVGKLKAAERRQALEDIESGRANIVIGTHALMQENVRFSNLGLSIIDEQHRFGVDQRLSLRDRRKRDNSGPYTVPHQLVMTATPIPRTLAMTAYSELDYSVIDELPPGRTPVQTALVSQKRRGELIERVRGACQSGAQAYWVCPLVEDSETLSAANAEETYTHLQGELSELQVGLVHGRLKPAEKEHVMREFKSGKLSLLVATTVIEVGVDVPNASLMIIENPERLGLAQLHQLRGRVGRGATASHCILLFGDKLSNQAKERLQVMRETNDGFQIAERDLQLRGPGELLGTKQAGDLSYRVADAQQHSDLLELAQEVGAQLLASQPDHAATLIQRWIGENTRYAEA